MELWGLFNRGMERFLMARGVASVTSDVNGAPLHHYALEGRGNGPPVVLLHGLNGNANGFAWVLFALRPRFRRIFAPDLPGHGFSPGGSSVSLQGLQRSLAAFCEQVVREPAFLVGNSLGGAMSIVLAQEHPEQVKALALVAPAGARVAPERLAEVFRSLRPSSAREVRALSRKLFHRPPLAATLFASALQQNYGAESLAALLQELKPTDAIEPDVLKALQMPVLLLWGESDGLLPAEGLDYFRAHLPPHAEIHRVKGFGHVPQIERPGELAQYLKDFADRHGF